MQFFFETVITVAEKCRDVECGGLIVTDKDSHKIVHFDRIWTTGR